MSLIDKLPAGFPFGKKASEPEYFFALLIEQSSVSAALWEMDGDRLEILGQSSLVYHGAEELLERIRRVLDRAVGALEVEPNQVLFGVPDSWTRDDDLKEPYLKLLRRILKEFDLKPLAYVSSASAISFFLQKQEGVPQTAILLGVGEFIDLSLVRGGKVVESRSVEHTGKLFDDLERVTGHLSEAEVLPSKILLYQNGETDPVKTQGELMSYPWMQKLPFLHFPKIDILASDIELHSIIFAGASEINPDIDIKHSLAAFSHPLPEAKIVRGKESLEKVSEEDEAEIKKEETEEKEELETEGFVKGDIREKINDGVEDEGEAEEDSFTARETEDFEEDQLITPDLPVQATNFPKTGFSDHLPQGNVLLMEISNRLTKLNHLKSYLPKKMMIVPAVLVVMIAAYLFLVKASVTVFVEPRILEKEAEIVADPKASVVDEEKKIIPASLVETTVTGTEKGEATGQKQIGDSARGKVVVYNLSDARVTVSQGTVLVASGGLKFTIDTSVQVASQSSTRGADYKTVTEPGKSVAVGATAVNIGPEGNLPADSELAVGNHPKSQVVARVEEAFAGGTAKDVTVVTADDQKKLKAKLLDVLKLKGEEDLKGKLPAEKKVIADALAVTDGKYTYSKQVNDQAKEFSLTATVHFKGTAYTETDLRTIVAKLVETNIPEHFELNLQSTETQADVAKVEKDGRLVFKAKFRAKLFPKLNEADLKKQMKGKGIAEAIEKLKQIENVIGSEVKLSPPVPMQVARMPLLDRNISIIITPK